VRPVKDEPPEQAPAAVPVALVAGVAGGVVLLLLAIVAGILFWGCDSSPTSVPRADEPAQPAPPANPGRFRVTAPEPVRLKPGEVVRVSLKLVRDRYSGPVQVRLEGLPDGVSAAEVRFAEGDSVAQLQLTAQAKAAPAVKEVRLVATAGARRDQPTFRVEVQRADQLSLALAGVAPTLWPEDSPRPMALKVTRQGLEDQPVQVTLVDAPSGVKVQPASVTVPPSKDRAEFTVQVPRLGSHALRFRASAGKAGVSATCLASVWGTTPPIKLGPVADARLESTGTGFLSQTVKVKLDRGGYKGPVTTRFYGLPVGVVITRDYAVGDSEVTFRLSGPVGQVRARQLAWLQGVAGGVTIPGYQRFTVEVRSPITASVGTGGPSWLAFGPGGKMLVTGGVGRLQMWDSATGAMKLSVRPPVLLVHPGGLWYLALGKVPGGQAWSATTGASLITPVTSATRAVASSPDGGKLAITAVKQVVKKVASGVRVNGGIRENTKSESVPEVRIYDTATWKLERSLSGVAFAGNPWGVTPDGKILVEGKPAPSAWKVWDMVKGELLYELKGKGYQNLLVSRDGKYLAGLGGYATADVVLNLPSGLGLHKFRMGAGPMAGFSPDSKYLAVPRPSGHISFRDLVTGEQVLDGDKRAIQFSLTGTLAHDGVLIYDLAERKKRSPALGVFLGGWSADGKVLAGWSGGKVLVVDAVTGKTLFTATTHTGLITHAVVSADGKRLAAVDSSGLVKVVEVDRR
jgi:WD40 repeat protein